MTEAIERPQQAPAGAREPGRSDESMMLGPILGQNFLLRRAFRRPIAAIATLFDDGTRFDDGTAWIDDPATAAARFDGGTSGSDN